MNDHDLASGLRAWLRDTEARPDDARHSADRVMARVREAGQRGRWWPLPTFGHGDPSASFTDREHRFAAISDPTYHLPTAIGRTRVMISPVKAIIGGSLVLALSATFLVAQMDDPRGGGVPGAEQTQDEAVTATYVTGEVTGYMPLGSGIPVDEDGLWMLSDDQYELEIAWSDPRLPSLKHGRENQYQYHKGDDLWAQALAGTIRLEGPDGAWVGTAHGMADQDADRGRQMAKVMVLDGEGAYDGLHAIIVATIDEAVTPLPSYEGFIFESDLPPFPDPVEPFPASE